jgi:hypothetical protein
VDPTAYLGGLLGDDWDTVTPLSGFALFSLVIAISVATLKIVFTKRGSISRKESIQHLPFKGYGAMDRGSFTSKLCILPMKPLP